MNSLQKMISNTSTQINTPVEKTCPLCQKKFIPKGRQKYCDGPHFKPCPVCGKPVPAPYPSDPARCCSSECRKQLKYKGTSISAETIPTPVEPQPKIEPKVEPKIEPKKVEVDKKEYPIDPDIELSKEKLEPLEKGAKAFFTKQCTFDSKIKGLIKGHVYSIEVTKDAYTYDVLLTYDHTYREDVEIFFNIASAISFNNCFK